MVTYNYQKLEVWKHTMALVEAVYKVCALLPKSEIHALGDQLKRSAVAIPSSIAEGHRRNNPKEFIYFLGLAAGATAALETQLILCKRLYKIDVKSELVECIIVGKMLTALIKDLK